MLFEALVASVFYANTVLEPVAKSGSQPCEAYHGVQQIQSVGKFQLYQCQDLRDKPILEIWELKRVDGYITGKPWGFFEIKTLDKNVK